MNSGTFSDFLFAYWWLVFPLAYFIGTGWNSWIKYKRHQANLELLKSYAASGNQPPADLLKSLDPATEKDASHDGLYSGGSKRGDGGKAFLVILFAGLAAIFAYAGYNGMMDLGEEAYFVAMIMGVLSVAFLGSAIFKSNKG